MALNQEYFASIQLELIKWKYYSASKVDALLADIRQQAQALIAENAMLRQQVEQHNSKRAEVNEAVMAAQAMYRDIVAKAQARAGQIIADAERRQTELEEEHAQQQEYTVQRAQNFYSRVRQQHVNSIEALDKEWQDFLCGLFPDEGSADESVPSDMSEKVGAIASELRAIGKPEAAADYMSATY